MSDTTEVTEHTSTSGLCLPQASETLTSQRLETGLGLSYPQGRWRCGSIWRKLLEGDSDTASWMAGLCYGGNHKERVRRLGTLVVFCIPKLNCVASALLSVLSPPNSAVPHLECLHSHPQGSAVII